MSDQGVILDRKSRSGLAWDSRSLTIRVHVPTPQGERPYVLRARVHYANAHRTLTQRVDFLHLERGWLNLIESEEDGVTGMEEPTARSGQLSERARGLISEAVELLHHAHS